MNCETARANATNGVSGSAKSRLKLSSPTFPSWKHKRFFSSLSWRFLTEAIEARPKKLRE
jgi:hypothetical protein